MSQHAFSTFRIRGLPSDLSDAKFDKFLSEHNVKPVHTNNRRLLSLARDAECSRSQRTGTVTIQNKPDQPPLLPKVLYNHTLQIDSTMEGFTPLNDTRDNEDYVNVIGITGLAGWAFASWQCATGEMWLRDFVPTDTPKARVHIYGYQSVLQKSTSASGIHQFAVDFTSLLKIYLKAETPSRPLILIGHSLGCIIIKQMLVQMARDPEYRDIFDSVYSIVFFGAPHRGYHTAALEVLVQGQQREPLIKDLKYDSPFLQNLSKEFSRISKDLKIISCYEMQETHTARAKESDPKSWDRTGPKAMMVEPGSARLFTPNEEEIGIDADHSKIAKLDEVSVAYQRLRKIIANHVDLAPQAVEAKFYRRGAVEVLAKICYLGRGLEPTLRSITNFGAIVGRLSDVIEFFSQFKDFLQDEVSAAILLRDSQSMPFARQILASVNEVYVLLLPYCSIADRQKAALWMEQEAMDVKQENSANKEDQTLLNFRRVSFLYDVASRCASQVRLLTTFAMLGVEDLTSLEAVGRSPSAQRLGFDKAALRQRLTRRASEVLEADFRPLEGSLEPKESTLSFSIASFSSDPSIEEKVIVECRPYGQDQSTLRLEDSMKRTLEQQEARDKAQLGRLAFLLQKLTEVHDDDSLRSASTGCDPCVLKCLGYVEQSHLAVRNVAILFEIPRLPAGAVMTSIKDLYFTIYDKSAIRSLEQRFKISWRICSAVLSVHSWGWLHKDIRSQNILLVPSGDALGFTAYLRGFEYARHVGDSTRMTGDHELEKDLYRHPERQKDPSRPYEKKHDLYALGVVLLEIGALKTVKAILDPWMATFRKQNRQPQPKDIARKIRTRAAEDLPILMGSRYADAVRRCLENDFEVTTSTQDDPSETELSMKFYDFVLQAIEPGCQI